MARLIQNYLQQAEQDDAVRVIVLTGRLITAEEAWRHGAISRISEGSAHEEVLKIAQQIAQKNSLATQAVKAIIRHELTQHEPPTFDYQQNWVNRVRQAAVKPF